MYSISVIGAMCVLIIGLVSSSLLMFLDVTLFLRFVISSLAGSHQWQMWHLLLFSWSVDRLALSSLISSSATPVFTSECYHMLYMETQPFMMNDILRLNTILWIIWDMDIICDGMISEL